MYTCTKVLVWGAEGSGEFLFYLYGFTPTKQLNRTEIAKKRNELKMFEEPAKEMSFPSQSYTFAYAERNI